MYKNFKGSFKQLLQRWLDTLFTWQDGLKPEEGRLADDRRDQGARLADLEGSTEHSEILEGRRLELADV